MDSLSSRTESDTETGAVEGRAPEAGAAELRVEVALGTALWQVIADLDPWTRALWGRCVWACECPCRPAAEHGQSPDGVIEALSQVAQRLDQVLAAFPAGASLQTAVTGTLYSGPQAQGAFASLIEGLHQHPHCARARAVRLKRPGRDAAPDTCSAPHRRPGRSLPRPDQRR